MRLSRRVAGLAESATLRLWSEAARLRRAGRDVVSLLEGESDLPAPVAVKSAVKRSLDRDETRYGASAGLPELRAAVARKLARENGVRCRDRNVLITNGAKQAIYEALQVLCSPGDEVVIPAPCWVTLPQAARLAGARPVFAECLGPGLDVDAIARAVTRKTKVVVLNTPNNPTGAVYAEAALKELSALAKRRDLFVLSDEAYEKLVFDGRRHVSPASLSRDMAKRTVTVQTFSKTHSMTGFRVGYLAADEAVVNAALRVHGHMTGNVAAFTQRGALAALALDPAHGRRLRETYERRRDLACALAAPLFDFRVPEGGFFIFADARRYLGRRFRDSAALASHLLTQALVAVVPGCACGSEGYLRLSYSGSENNIREGLRRIGAAL